MTILAATGVSLTPSSGSGGSGDVVGPASSTDNTLARFDATTGKLIQGSGIVVDDSNNVTGVGTLASGAQVLTSAAAQALAVGANGATNPAFTVDASTASSATGVSVKSNAAGAGASITATSSGTNESIAIAAKGTGTATLNGGASAAMAIGGSSVVSATATTITLTNIARSYTSNSGMLYTLPVGANLSAGAESTGILLNLSNTQTHATGTISLQRDMRVRPSTHGFSVASTITDAYGLYIDGAPIAGTNATITNSYTLGLGGNAVGSGVTNSYGLVVDPNTGATTNWAARFNGDVQVASGAIKSTRIDPRTVSLTDAATVTPNSDTTDIGILTSLSQNTTLANPTGTPVDSQKLMLRIKSTVARTLTFGAQYRGSTDLALPAATSGGGLTDYLGFIWNAADSKWDYLAKNFGY